jgi:C-terminal processing protease CtpA/Prc
MVMRWFTVIVFLRVCSYGAHPVPKNATEAYEYVQGLREKARTEGVKALYEALDYLEQPLIRDLAAGNRNLRSSASDVHFDVILAHATAGNSDEMYRSLEWLARVDSGQAYETNLEKSPAFARFRSEERFQKLLAAFKKAPFWETQALRTQYTENMTDAEKIAGLSKFWSEAKYNFAYVDKLRELDWDRQYLEYIPKVLATKSTVEYYKALAKFAAKLEDGHTAVTVPGELPVGLKTGLLDGKVFIISVPSRRLRDEGFTAGVEIESIDGVPAVEYGETRVMPYVSSSTKQDREQRTYGLRLLAGPINSTVRLGLLLPSGEKVEKRLERRIPMDLDPVPAFSWRMLAGNIAYVGLNSFGSEVASADFEKSFDQIAKADAIVFDVRQNGGGSSTVGWRILCLLTNKAFATGRYRYRSYIPTHRALGTEIDWIETTGVPYPAHGRKLYSKPVVVLSGPGTYSAAEDFLIAFETMKRGKILGQPSGGSTGQPLFFSLPGGGIGQVCTKQDMYPDGRIWVGKGIQPHVEVKLTAEDLRTGRDPVLEAAVAELRKESR